MDQRQWDEAYASAELVWTAEANRFVVEELAGLAAGRALDLGTGEGRGGPGGGEGGEEGRQRRGGARRGRADKAGQWISASGTRRTPARNWSGPRRPTVSWSRSWPGWPPGARSTSAPVRAATPSG